MSYIGDVSFNVEGSSEKSITLDVQNDVFDSNFFEVLDKNQLRWEIGLTPNIPLELDFSGGVGEITLDLSGLTLSNVQLSGGVGELTVTLPSNEGMYSVQIHGGVGKFSLVIEDGAQVELDINAGVGEFSIDIPDGAAAELHADTGIGEIRLPSNFTELSSSSVGISGSWLRESQDESSGRVLIEYRGGVGSLRIH